MTAPLPPVVVRRSAKIAARVVEFGYALAGKRAPVEVRKAVERFRKLPMGVKSRVPLLYWLLGDGTPPYKMRKAEVLYGSVPPGKTDQQCGNCNRLYWHPATGTYICDWVRGTIDVSLWCRVWSPPVGPAQYREYQERE